MCVCLRAGQAPHHSVPCCSTLPRYDANKSNTIDEKELANLLKDMDLDEDAHEEFEHANASHSGAMYVPLSVLL